MSLYHALETSGFSLLELIGGIVLSLIWIGCFLYLCYRALVMSHE